MGFRDRRNNRKKMRANFHWARGYIAAKTTNKDLAKIHLHAFRHFFATKLYLQTRDIRYVQKKMGHRSITSTTIYENSELKQDMETYTVKAVTTIEEDEKLVALTCSARRWLDLTEEPDVFTLSFRSHSVEIENTFAEIFTMLEIPPTNPLFFGREH